MEEPRLRELRDHYNNAAEPRSWDQYWEDMLGVTWADHYFIRASAIYLDFNIEIITTSTTKEHPSITVPCGLPGRQTLWIGNITDLHYQSILKDNTQTKTIKDDLSTNDSKKWQKEVQDKDSEKQKKSEECPVCKKSFIVLLQHLKKKATCNAQIQSSVLDEMERDVKQKSQQRNKDKGNQSRRKAESRQRMKDLDPEELKKKQKIEQANQRQKKREIDLESFMASENERRSKNRIVETEADRLREFRDATMLSALFICISCHCKTFKSNVQEFTDKIMSEIAAKIPLED